MKGFFPLPHHWRIRKTEIVLLALVTALCLSACSVIPVDKLIESAPSTAVPILPSPSPLLPQPQSSEAYTMEVTTQAGTELVLRDAAVCELLLRASENDALRLENAACSFPHELRIYGEQGELIKKVSLAGDGCLNARDEDGNVFMVPQYVWSAVDTALWEQMDELWSEDWVWDPEVTGTAALEMRLPYLLNTILAHNIGCADAYFSSYHIYRVDTGEKQLTIDLLSVQIACAREGSAFKEIYCKGLPVRLTLEKAGEKQWRLAGYKQADFSQGVKKEAVRAVFSYEDTALAMEELSDLSAYLEPMRMQVRSFMLTHGLSDLQWEY